MGGRYHLTLVNLPLTLDPFLTRTFCHLNHWAEQILLDSLEVDRHDSCLSPGDFAATEIQLTRVLTSHCTCTCPRFALSSGACFVFCSREHQRGGAAAPARVSRARHAFSTGLFWIEQAGTS